MTDYIKFSVARYADGAAYMLEGTYSLTDEEREDYADDAYIADALGAAGLGTLDALKSAAPGSWLSILTDAIADKQHADRYIVPRYV